MSKAQINYLLVLATIFVGWLFFHTFYMGAKVDAKMGMMGGAKLPIFERSNLPVVAPNMANLPDAMKMFAPSGQTPPLPSSAALLPSVVQNAEETASLTVVQEEKKK